MHTLIGIAFSHYVEKARWGLERFGVPYEDRRYLPLFHMAPVYAAHGGKVGRADKASSRLSTPVLQTDDGRTFADSAEILHYVSERFARPEDDLYPNEEAAELEMLFHDRLGPHTRRLGYASCLDRPELFKAMALNNVDRAQGALFMMMKPVAKQAITRLLEVRPEAVARSIEKVQQEIEHVSQRLADGRRFLTGDRFTAADLTFAALAAPVLLPEGYSAWLPSRDQLSRFDQNRTDELRATPAGQFALRMYAEERRRVLPQHTATPESRPAAPAMRN